MVQSGIVLGHRVSFEGIKVDQAKFQQLKSFLLQRMSKVSEAFLGMLVSTNS